MIADHEEDQGHGHVRVVLRSKRGQWSYAVGRRSAGLGGSDDLPLVRPDAHPHVGRHDRTEHRPDVNESRTRGHDHVETERCPCDKHEGNDRPGHFVF